MSFNPAEHARQRLVHEQLQSIRDSLELIEQALVSRYFKSCPTCGQADLATDLHATYCLLCGTPYALVNLADDPTASTACGEQCRRVKCGRDPRTASGTPPSPHPVPTPMPAPGE